MIRFSALGEWPACSCGQEVVVYAKLRFSTVKAVLCPDVEGLGELCASSVLI